MSNAKIFTKMLIPLDGSELAEVVFPYAQEFAGRLDLALIFLNVYSSEESEFAPMRRAYVEQACEIVRRGAEEVRKTTGVQPGVKALEARCEVVVGHPADEILRYAEENDIDLIVMATHGRSGIKRWAIGSVADKVLSASKIPVCLVRAGVPEEISYDKWPRVTILVPLDGSELAESVLPYFEVLAKQRGAKLVDMVLLRVCEPCEVPLIPPGSRASMTPYDSSVRVKSDGYVKREMAKRRRETKQYLARVEKRFKDVGLTVRSEMLDGNPADEIINYASRNPFNLIVMATHGRSGLSRWAYGSVADRVLRGVSSPIFLVRPG